MSAIVRRLLASSLLALAALGATRAHAAADACGALAPLPLGFRFHAGARPAAPPAVAADGSIYLGTADGYVHALAGDGNYRWGYTLRGPVIGNIAVGTGGTLLVPTPRRVYAIRADGSLAWIFESPIPIHAGLVPDAQGRYFFSTDDGKLFALSARGALIANVPGKVPFCSEPIALGMGVAAAREDGSVLWAIPGKNLRFELGRRVRELVACSGADVCALGAGELWGVGAEGVRFRLGASRAAPTGDRLALVTPDRRLELFANAGSQRLFSTQLPAEASAAPFSTESGRVFVPLENGVLLGFSASGAPESCQRIGDAPLGTLRADSAGKRLLVTASNGVLASVEVD